MANNEDGALLIAVETLYLSDNSDYKKALYRIIEQLKGHDFMMKCYDDINSVHAEIINDMSQD